MSRARVNIGGSSSSGSSSSSSASDGDTMQKIKLGGAVGVLVVAFGLIAWNQGWFESRGGGEAVAPPPVVVDTPAPTEEPVATEDPNNPGRTFEEAPPATPTRRGGGLVAPGYDPNAPENNPPAEPTPPPSDGGGY